MGAAGGFWRERASVKVCMGRRERSDFGMEQAATGQGRPPSVCEPMRAPQNLFRSARDTEVSVFF